MAESDQSSDYDSTWDYEEYFNWFPEKEESCQDVEVTVPCSVCLEDFGNRANYIAAMACGHAFHCICLINTFNMYHQNGQPNQCPLCRKELDGLPTRLHVNFNNYTEKIERLTEELAMEKKKNEDLEAELARLRST